MGLGGQAFLRRDSQGGLTRGGAIGANGTIISSSENSKCRGPEAGRSLTGFKNQNKACEAGSQ